MSDPQPMVRIPQKWPLYTFVTAIVFASIWYADMRTAAKDNAEKIAKHEVRLEGLTAKQGAHELELATSRVNQENMLRILAEMRQDLREIKKQGSVQ